MVGNKNIVEIVNGLLEGHISIEQVWADYETDIRSVNSCNTYDEVMSLMCLYYRYGTYLANKGYYKDALPYLEKSLSVLISGMHLVPKETYNDFLEEILRYKSTVLYKLEKYKETLECLKILKKHFPERDEFKIDYDRCFQILLNKYINPFYLLIVLFWGIYSIDCWLLNTDILPRWTFDIGWYLWIILVVIQFVLPWIKKINK